MSAKDSNKEVRKQNSRREFYCEGPALTVHYKTIHTSF